MKKYYISLDAGATNLKAALVSNNKIIKFLSHPTEVQRGKKQISKNVLGIIDELARDKKISGLAIAWPWKNNIKLSQNEIYKILQKKYSWPIKFANDADLFTLGEAYFGQGKKYKVVMGITLGSGLGSGLAINKQIFTPQGKTIEFGHTIVNPNGPKCSCGNHGCLEEYLSIRGLMRLIKQNKVPAKNGEELYNLAHQKNKKAVKVWQQYGRQIAWGIISMQNAYNPEIFIIGGKISKAWQFFAPSMKKEIKNRYYNNIIIKKTTLDNTAILGAVKLFKK